MTQVTFFSYLLTDSSPIAMLGNHEYKCRSGVCAVWTWWVL